MQISGPTARESRRLLLADFVQKLVEKSVSTQDKPSVAMLPGAESRQIQISPPSAPSFSRRPHGVGKIIHQYIYADQKHPDGQYGEAPADVVAADQNGKRKEEPDISDPTRSDASINDDRRR